MPADPAAPVTEPRAELARQIFASAHQCGVADLIPDDEHEIAKIAALLDGHEQQIRAEVAGEIKTTPLTPEYQEAVRCRIGYGQPGEVLTLMRDWCASLAVTWNADDEEEGGVR